MLLLHWYYFSLSEYHVILICLQYTILDDGCVCMEFFRVNGSTLTVVEVMHISANGLQVKFCNHEYLLLVFVLTLVLALL